MLTKFTHRAVIVLDLFRCLAMWLAASVVFLTVSPRTTGQKKKILVIRMDAIGDFILWLDAAKGLRSLYPDENYEITLLGNDIWSSLAMELPPFNRVWPLNRKKYLLNPLYCINMLRKVRREGFDLVISPAYSREFKFCDIIAKVSGSPNRVGSKSDDERIRRWQKQVGNLWYTRLIPAREEPLMELERNAEFLRGLGADNFRASLPELPVSGTVPEGFTAQDYFVIVPGASSAIKQWPSGHFLELARRIHAKTGWTGIICGDTKEKPLGDTVSHWSDNRSENWAGRTSLKELSAIIAGAHLVITNDTSAVHIAAAVATPAACILGGGHYGRFLPYQLEAASDKALPVAVFSKMDCYGCRWAYCTHATLNGTARCISSITVQQVWDAVSDKLGT
jgi:ADP-heptose:LPS heptosyltransferase